MTGVDSSGQATTNSELRVQSARDRAIEAVDRALCSANLAEVSAFHVDARLAVDALLASPAVLRALAGEAGAPAAPAEPEHVIAGGARALFDLTRAAQLSPNPDRLWERMCADGDRPYFDQAEAVLRAAWPSGEAGAPDTPPACQHGDCAHCDASKQLCTGLIERTGVPCCGDCAQFQTHGAPRFAAGDAVRLAPTAESGHTWVALPALAGALADIAEVVGLHRETDEPDVIVDRVREQARRLQALSGTAAVTTPADAHLLDMDRDAAIEAAADALAEMNDPEDGGGEFAHAAVTAALGYLSSQPYPVTLGPARRTEETS